MARDGAGNFSLPYPDFVAGTTIESAQVDANNSDIATAMTASIAKDGQTVPTANLPMGGFKHTGVDLASALTDYARADQVIGSVLDYAIDTGTATAYAIAPSPGISAYVIGQRFALKTTNANSGADPTLAVNGLTAGIIYWPNGASLIAGEIPDDALVEVIVATTAPTFHLQSCTKPALPRTGGTMTGTLTMSAAAINEAVRVDVASATTTDIGAAASNYVRITGTTTITGLGTIASGVRRTVVFADILTLTHNGTSLILPGAANITTAAGDTAEFVSEGSGNWRCLSYQRASYAPGGGQSAWVLTGAVNSDTAAIPLDDTIPQSGEGFEVMTLAITPRSATSRLRIEVTCNISSSAQDNPIVALFQDSTADALAAVIVRISDANASVPATFSYEMVSGTTSATTFKVRAGTTSASAITFNGIGAARQLGGVMASSIRIEERI